MMRRASKHSLVASIPNDLFDTLAAVGAHGQKMANPCEPKQEAEIQTIWEAESACNVAQVALLGEY
eukprot:625938-Pleurochrysis_carterae.AAC.3